MRWLESLSGGDGGKVGRGERRCDWSEMVKFAAMGRQRFPEHTEGTSPVSNVLRFFRFASTKPNKMIQNIMEALGEIVLSLQPLHGSR